MDLSSISHFTGQLPFEVLDEKHLSSGRVTYKPKTYRRTRSHVVRSTAKRLVQNNPDLCRELNSVWEPSFVRGSEPNSQHGAADAAPSAQRALIEKNLRWEFSWHNPAPDRGRVTRTRGNWYSDEAEGQDLARSALPLPSDRNRLVRRPSLEREDAFRDANTTKTSTRQRPRLSTEDAQVAELYRLGLLYDDEQDRGEGFNLNTISHDAPLYSIRPARRSRKSKAKGYGLGNPLHLDLSFTDLGDNDAIAQYLMAATAVTSSDEDSTHHTSEPSTQGYAPLRVIYEVENSTPSFDVDTSQPPDLVSDDFLSDYDYFSDMDLDDLPSQREVRDSAATPGSDAWVVLGDDS